MLKGNVYTVHDEGGFLKQLRKYKCYYEDMQNFIKNSRPTDLNPK